MPSFSHSEVILVRYPFTDLSGAKVRAAVVVNAPHVSRDVIIVPLTSRVSGLLAGEFALADWQQAGLNVPSAVKRGLYTVKDRDCHHARLQLRGGERRPKMDIQRSVHWF